MITAYDLEVFTPPCSPGALTFSAIARLQGNIAPVLPYLNAVLSDAVYNPGAPALVWKDGRRHIVFHADHLAVSNLEDRNAAVEEVERLVRLVNETWQERERIEPSYAVRQRPTPMMLYKLLPGTNCRQCGEPTCWNFALKLGAGLADLAACLPLSGPVYAGQRAELAALVYMGVSEHMVPAGLLTGSGAFTGRNLRFRRPQSWSGDQPEHDEDLRPHVLVFQDELV